MADPSHLSLIEKLEQVTKPLFAELGDASLGAVTVTSAKGQAADYQCNGAMAAAKLARANPRDLAQTIVAKLKDRLDFATVEVAGPGFINFSLADQALDAQMAWLAQDPRSGHRRVEKPEKIVLDYGGPNAAKAMHVGHLRSAVIGQSLKNILRFQGHNVEGDIHLGDWGLQMGQLITEIERENPKLPYFDPNAKGPFPKEPPCSMEDLLRIYPQASARSKQDPAAREAARIATAELQAGRPGYRALWQHFADVSMADIHRDYDRMGIDFEHWFGESRYQSRLIALTKKLVDMGVAVESEGALVIPVAKDENDTIPPLILRNSDEGFGYGATDLATLDERINEFQAQAVLYVVDARQALHFEQVFRAAKKSIAKGKAIDLEHLAFGTVNGPDGKPFKTREGGVMRLGDLMGMLIAEAKARIEEAGMGAELSPAEAATVADIVGLGALKFADLQHDRESDYIFDIKRFTKFEGRTGPYLQYTGVRIKSLLAKAEAAGLAFAPVHVETAVEHQLVLLLDRFQAAVERAAELRKPHILAEHLYGLAGLFNQFYHGSHILTEADRARAGSWLTLCKAVLGELELGLALLGIEVPTKM